MNYTQDKNLENYKKIIKATENDFSTLNGIIQLCIKLGEYETVGLTQSLCATERERIVTLTNEVLNRVGVEDFKFITLSELHNFVDYLRIYLSERLEEFSNNPFSFYTKPWYTTNSYQLMNYYHRQAEKLHKKQEYLKSEIKQLKGENKLLKDVLRIGETTFKEIEEVVNTDYGGEGMTTKMITRTMS